MWVRKNSKKMTRLLNLSTFSLRQIIYAFIAIVVSAMLLAGCARGKTNTEISAAQAPASGPARIGGRVTASDTAEPVAYVQVVFFDLDGNQVGPPGNTDLSGSYSVELPAGRYYGVANIVNPSHPLGWNGLSPLWTGGRPVKDPQGVFEVAPEEKKTIDFALLRLRTCKGRVKAEASPSIPSNSIVAALDAVTGEHFAEVNVDPSGSYEILLPDGEWWLRATVPGFAQTTASKAVVAGTPSDCPTLTVVPAG